MAKASFLNRPEVRAYGTPALFVLLGILLLALVAFPSWGKIRDLRQQIGNEKDRIVALDKKNTQLLDFADQADAIEKNFAVLDQAVASESQIPELLTQVQKMSDSCGVGVTTLQFSGEAKQSGGSVQEVRLQYAGEGSLAQLTCLITALESTSRLIDLESLRYNSNVNAETGVTSLAAQSTLISYYTPVPSPDPDTPITFSLSDPGYLRNLKLLESFKIY